MSETPLEKPVTLTRAEKAAATKAAKRRREQEAMLQRHAETQREYEAAEASRRAEDRRFWIDAQAALLVLGRAAPVRSGRATFTHAGGVAILLSLVANGDRSRDDILKIMRQEYRYSYRHAGYLLGQLCGHDSAQHLWFKQEDGLYKLHADVPACDLKVAA